MKKCINLTVLFALIVSCANSSKEVPLEEQIHTQHEEHDTHDMPAMMHQEHDAADVHEEHNMGTTPHNMPAGEEAVRDPLSDERAAYEKARPVLEQYCARCHTSPSKNHVALRHFNMDSYPLQGHHAHEIGQLMRRVLGASGKPATMPIGQPGVIKGEQLKLILDWADLFDSNHQGGAHKDHKNHKH